MTSHNSPFYMTSCKMVDTRGYLINKIMPINQINVKPNQGNTINYDQPLLLLPIGCWTFTIIVWGEKLMLQLFKPAENMEPTIPQSALSFSISLCSYTLTESVYFRNTGLLLLYFSGKRRIWNTHYIRDDLHLLHCRSSKAFEDLWPVTLFIIFSGTPAENIAEAPVARRLCMVCLLFDSCFRAHIFNKLSKCVLANCHSEKPRLTFISWLWWHRFEIEVIHFLWRLGKLAEIKIYQKDWTMLTSVLISKHCDNFISLLVLSKHSLVVFGSTLHINISIRLMFTSKLWWF